MLYNSVIVVVYCWCAHPCWSATKRMKRAFSFFGKKFTFFFVGKPSGEAAARKWLKCVDEPSATSSRRNKAKLSQKGPPEYIFLEKYIFIFASIGRLVITSSASVCRDWIFFFIFFVCVGWWLRDVDQQFGRTFLFFSDFFLVVVVSSVWCKQRSN